MTDAIDAGIDDFREIVRRNIGRASDSDTACTIDKKVRKSCRKDSRFQSLIIESRNHLDRILVKIHAEIFT